MGLAVSFDHRVVSTGALQRAAPAGARAAAHRHNRTDQGKHTTNHLALGSKTQEWCNE